ncbi:MAG: LpqB family beta-propeller domain-containing protein [Vicinamibacterales bacterium]
MTKGAVRVVGLLALLGAGAAAFLYARSRETPPGAHRLAWVVDAHQFGPVGYRDPAGAISPDGGWIAYSEGRFLRVRSTAGGPLVDLPAGEAQIRTIAWSPDNRTILTDGFQTQNGWALYDRIDGTRRPLWADRDPLKGGTISDLRQPAWSSDGRAIAAIVNGREGQELWTIAADGSTAHAQHMLQRIAYPAWTPRGEIACVATTNRRARLTVPCGAAPIRTDPDLDVYGPMAFSPDAATVYISLANESGTLDLWAAPSAGGRARRLTSFARDTYAPTVAADGSVLFKVQSYRTTVALAPASGGPSRPLAQFQSETPSWDPAGRQLGITYGTWRRVMDDAHYPDIAQDAGIIAVDSAHPATQPARVVHASVSEDQALCWSPNGKWIAFHSHQDQSDDVWLKPAVGETPPRRISFLGRGAEVGWPRWSPDGKWLLFDGASRASHRSVMFVAGIDQDGGAVTREPVELSLRSVDAEVSHAEWMPDSAHLVVVAKEGPGRHVVVTLARDGGDERLVHRFESEHDAPGLAVSPDGRQIAFVAPAPDGFFQVFRMPIAGGPPVAVTSDRSNKTQPAWSPDGRQLAFTVWNYDAQFWMMR